MDILQMALFPQAWEPHQASRCGLWKRKVGSLSILLWASLLAWSAQEGHLDSERHLYCKLQSLVNRSKGIFFD